jgi:hypothetical protein
MAPAGPPVTLAIAAILLLVLGAAPPSESICIDASPRGVLAQLALANFTLALFNLLPASPLDVGRTMRAIFCVRLAHRPHHSRKSGREANDHRRGDETRRAKTSLIGSLT